MRELARGQSIQFLVAEDVAKVIRKKLALPADEPLSQDHILKFCLKNQMEQLSDDTVVVAKLKMLNMIQWEIIKILLDPQISNEQVSQLFVEEMLDIFCPEQPTEAHAMYGGANRQTPTEQLLKKELQDCLSLINKLSEKVELIKQRIDPAEIEKQIKALIADELLPETALASANESLDQFVQVQQKQKQKTKQQQQTQEVVQKKQDKTKWVSFPWPDVAPEKIFDPAYYKQSFAAELYQMTSLLPDIPTPPMRHLIAPIAVFIAVNVMPYQLKYLSAALVGGLIIASKFNYQAAGIWQDAENIGSELYRECSKWIQEKQLPMKAWAEGHA